MVLWGMCSTNILIKLQKHNLHKAVAKHLMTPNYIISNIFIWYLDNWIN